MDSIRELIHPSWKADEALSSTPGEYVIQDGLTRRAVWRCGMCWQRDCANYRPICARRNHMSNSGLHGYAHSFALICALRSRARSRERIRFTARLASK